MCSEKEEKGLTAAVCPAWPFVPRGRFVSVSGLVQYPPYWQAGGAHAQSRPES